METAAATFADYQAKYENSIFPVVVKETISEVKESFHHVAVKIDEWMKVPDVVVQAIQMGTTILSFVPSVEPILKGPKQICKDFKIVAGLTKGFKSVDSLLNFTAAWKIVVLQISGMTLFAFSVLSFIERFALVQTTTIKVALAAIPMIGVLPNGGLVVLSLSALSTTLLILSIEKHQKLNREEKRLIEEKQAFWSKPLDVSKIGQKQLNYEHKVVKFLNEIMLLEAILEEGLRIEGTLVTQDAEKKKLLACRQAIQELIETIQSKKEKFRTFYEKYGAWELLQKQWSSIDPYELEQFRQAKAEKCVLKLKRIRFEKKANLLSMASSTILIFKQVVTLGGLFSNRVNLPFSANVTLELVGTVCGLTTFFLKRLLEKEIPGVHLSSYVNLAP